RRRGGSGGGRFGGGLGRGAAQALEGEHRAGGDGGAADQREQEHQRVADQRGPQRPPCGARSEAPNAAVSAPVAAEPATSAGITRSGSAAANGMAPRLPGRLRRGAGGQPRGASSAKRGVSGRPPAARSAALSPISGANLAPCLEQGEQTTTGPERSSTNSSSAVEVYRQVASLKGSGSSPGSQRRT